jgi:hypothetical protein
MRPTRDRQTSTQNSPQRFSYQRRGLFSVVCVPGIAAGGWIGGAYRAFWGNDSFSESGPPQIVCAEILAYAFRPAWVGGVSINSPSMWFSDLETSSTFVTYTPGANRSSRG